MCRSSSLGLFLMLAAATATPAQQQLLRLGRLHALAQAAAAPPAPAQELQDVARLSASLYSHTEPLDARIMPLCGNGAVDTAADYRAHYAALAGGGWYNLSADFPASAHSMRQSVSGYTDALFARFRFVADEVCDDGNRRDGDGCSADCLEFDALAPPCELDAQDPALGGARLVQVFEWGGQRVMGVTNTSGVYELRQAPGAGALNATRLAPPSGLPLQVATVAGASADLVGAGVSGGTMYLTRWANAWAPVAAAPAAVAFAMPAGSYPDVLVAADATWAVAVAVGSSGFAVGSASWAQWSAAPAAAYVNVTSPGRCTRASFLAPQPGLNYGPVIVACGRVSVAINWGSPDVTATVVEMPPSRGNLLDQALNALITASSSTVFGTRPATTGFEFDPSQDGAASAFAQAVLPQDSALLAIVSRQVVIRAVPGARALLTGFVALGGIRALGDAALVRSVSTFTDFGYCTQEGCPLDNITTTYDAFSPAADAGGGESLMQALADALPSDSADLTAPLPDAVAALVRAVVAAPPPRVTALAGRGGPLWGVTPAGRLVQISRGGVVYRTPGSAKCWPAIRSLLCPQGSWSSGAACRPCGAPAATSDDQAAQWMACPPPAAASRRRLLQQQQQQPGATDVTAGIRTPLPAAWPSAAYPCAPDAGGAFCVVTVHAADPAAALRNLSAAIAAAGASVWSPPHAVISPQPPPSPPSPPTPDGGGSAAAAASTAQGASLPLILGLAAAGVLALGLISLAIWWWASSRRVSPRYEEVGASH